MTLIWWLYRESEKESFAILVERKTLAPYGAQHWSLGASARERGIQILKSMVRVRQG